MGAVLMDDIKASLERIEKNQRAIMEAMIVHARYLTVEKDLRAILEKRLNEKD